MIKSNLFSNLSYEDFRRLASDPNLSKNEKIGFPDHYRNGFESNIFSDICLKLTNLRKEGQTVLEIGPGCGELPIQLIGHCRNQKHFLHLIDSPEMLEHIPDDAILKKHAAMFPNCPEFIESHQSKIDCILCYSVLQYVLIDVAFFRFLDISLSLLAPNGQLLIGDIPNISKRKRFFSSETGIRFHQEFMKTIDNPEVRFNQIEHDQIDDAVTLAMLYRARAQGFDAYVLPQDSKLPMANRREDILVIRP